VFMQWLLFQVPHVWGGSAARCVWGLAPIRVCGTRFLMCLWLRVPPGLGLPAAAGWPMWCV